jgi:5-methylcytosine-specific restriction endonuclease McrA
LYDHFGLDSFSDGKQWWAAWYAARGVLRGVQLRNKVLQSASLPEQKAIAKWRRNWKKQYRVACHWCKHSFSPHNCEADHVVPISRGGVHALSNLVISCVPCNRTKRDRDPKDWIRILALSFQ